MLGKEYGLYPEDSAQAWAVESFLEHYRDLAARLYQVMTEKDEERKKELGKEVLTNIIPAWLSVHEKRLEQNGQDDHFVGDKTTIYDIKMLAVIKTVFLNEKVPHHEEFQAIFKNYPRLNTFYETAIKQFADF